LSRFLDCKVMALLLIAAPDRAGFGFDRSLRRPSGHRRGEAPNQRSERYVRHRAVGQVHLSASMA
jgi:hypothetical protein